MRSLVLTFACLLLVVPCQARIITVDDDGPADFATIQAAIDDSDDGDIIEVRPGAYKENVYFYGKRVTLTSIDPNDPNIVGETIIDGNQTDSVLTLAWGEDANTVVAGFTITNGRAKYGGGILCWGGSTPSISRCTITGNYAEEIGGAMYGGSGITKCTIANNTATRAGGLYGCRGDVIDCTFTDNSGSCMYDCEGNIIRCTMSRTARASGVSNCTGRITDCVITHNNGGVAEFYGDIVNCIIAHNSVGIKSCVGDIMDCVVSSSQSSGIMDVRGGITRCSITENGDYGVADHHGAIANCTVTRNASAGLYDCSGDITDCVITENGGAGVIRGGGRIVGCQIARNSASHSGGGVNRYTGSIIGCDISENSARYGGGIYISYGYGDLTIVNCTLTGNWATDGSGGGIYCHSGNPTIKNCIISGNTAFGDGGGLYNCGGQISNNTIVGNRAYGTGGAIYCGEECSPVISNNIICNTTSGSGIFWIYGEPVISYNNLYRNADGDYGGWAWAGEGDISVDACFVNPGHWDDPCDTPEEPWDDIWVDGDYHLKSQAGRWDPNSGMWVQDNVTSPCIDVGDISSPIGHEPFPNGGIANMGAYGGTVEATKSYFGDPVCETIVAGDINGDCKVDYLDFALMSFHWLEDNSP